MCLNLVVFSIFNLSMIGIENDSVLLYYIFIYKKKEPVVKNKLKDLLMVKS